MASLFQGSPQKATSYTTSTSQTPKWMEDAIYNQIQWATNIANKPYPEYNMPRVAELSPLQQQAYKNVANNQGFWQQGVDQAQAGTYGLSQKGTAADLGLAQSQYTQPQLAGQMLQSGQGLLGQAQQTTGQALQGSALEAANPYLQSAGQTSAQNVGQYMSPYQQGVLDVIAKQGARNLTQNLLPGISDAFIKAGQFGSSRMGEMGSRALRDTQEAILNQQAQALQQGYGQALSASQADLGRQAQLASTAGNLGSSDLQRILQAGAQYGSLGQAQTAAGQAQQQLGLSAAQAQQQAAATDQQRQLAALNQYAQMQQQEQSMRTADTAALEAAGAAQQAQQQKQLDAAYQQFQEKQLYPKQQLDWLNTQIRGMAPITPVTTTQAGTTTGATYSPSILSQLASGYGAYKGLSSLG